MPVVEDWLNRPLDIVQGYFDISDAEWNKKVNEYFAQKFSREDAFSWIPSINEVPLHQLKPNSLVRYRGMIQDMFDPEFFLGVYEVEDLASGNRSYKTGKYQDIAECLPGQQINMESRQNVTMDRQTYYCIPVPGENAWVKQIYSEMNQKTISSLKPSTSVRPKRELEEAEETNATKSNATIATSPAAGSVEVTTIDRQTSTNGSEPSGNSRGVDLNLHYPLSGEEGPPCIVKVYDQYDSLKLNEMVEIVGVLAVDPILTQFPDQSSDGDLAPSGEDESMDGIEEQSALPPSSLVPRLHAISIRQLQHINPLLKTSFESTHILPPTVQEIQSEAGKLRDQLRGLLQQLLLGDAFSADYLLLHLLANVYARRDVVPLGKFSLNLSSCPNVYTRKIYEVIEQLVTKSHFLPLTVGNLNSLQMTPKKDYSANRLKSGLLQLSERTELVLDETAMEPGQLDSNGIQNIAAVGNAMSWQKLDYDFNFHRTEFPTNIKFLVLSEGKSLLPCDCQVPVTPRNPPGDLDTFSLSIQRALSSDAINLRDIRRYLTAMPLLEYTLSEDVQKVLEQDFVDARRNDPQSMTADDFHTLLVLSRLMSLSLGQTSLKREVWERVKRMEAERKSRLRNQAPRT